MKHGLPPLAADYCNLKQYNLYPSYHFPPYMLFSPACCLPCAESSMSIGTSLHLTLIPSLALQSVRSNISCDTGCRLVLDRLGLFWSFHVAIFILKVNSNQIISRCYQCHCPFAKVYGLSSCSFGDFLLATGLGFAPGFNLCSVKHRKRI